jgi:hypothetical protein
MGKQNGEDWLVGWKFFRLCAIVSAPAKPEDVNCGRAARALEKR